MTKVEEIFRAWSIAFNPNDAQIDLAAMRIQICNGCFYKRSIEVGNKEILMRCGECGCALKGKIYTPKTYKDPGGSCPKDYWSKAEDVYLLRKEAKKAHRTS
jgi:hypothetical protein